MGYGKATVLLSGGIDSSACAYFLKEKGFKVYGTFINYGQAAFVSELKAAQTISIELNIPLQVLEIKNSKFGEGELIGRNAFLIMSAIFLGQAHEGILATGIHAGTSYYDCSKRFLSHMDRLIQEHTDSRLSLITPFIEISKEAVIDVFNESGINIFKTYSCESGNTPCGVCQSCKDRNKYNVS